MISVYALDYYTFFKMPIPKGVTRETMVHVKASEGLKVARHFQPKNSFYGQLHQSVTHHKECEL